MEPIMRGTVNTTTGYDLAEAATWADKNRKMAGKAAACAQEMRRSGDTVRANEFAARARDIAAETSAAIAAATAGINAKTVNNDQVAGPLVSRLTATDIATQHHADAAYA